MDGIKKRFADPNPHEGHENCGPESPCHVANEITIEGWVQNDGQEIWLSRSDVLNAVEKFREMFAQVAVQTMDPTYMMAAQVVSKVHLMFSEVTNPDHGIVTEVPDGIPADWLSSD